MGGGLKATLVVIVLTLALLPAAPAALAGVSDLPLRPIALGDLVTHANSLCSLTLASDTFLYFSDFQILYMWATVTNLSAAEDRFRVAPVTDVPPGWLPPRSEGEHIRLAPGETGEIKFICKAEYEGQVGPSDNISTVFTYRVSSLNQPDEIFDFNFTVNVHPQMADSGYTNASTAVSGYIQDRVTGEAISGAEVSLFIGETIRLLPYDMITQSDGSGRFELTCWDINTVNAHHAPYFSVPGYYLMVQREGYQTYVSPEPLTPSAAGAMDLLINLDPLGSAPEYRKIWGTPLFSPGVFEIAVNPGWTRFAAALGKHPDADDPTLMPTKMPYLDTLGNILWSKDLPDESWGIDLSADDSMAGCAYNGGYYVWDTAGTELWNYTLPEGSPTASIEIKFSRDSAYVAAGPVADNDFALYQARTGQTAFSGRLDGAVVRSIAFLPDGQNFVIGGHPYQYDFNGSSAWNQYITYSPYMLVPSSDGNLILAADKGDCLTMFNGSGAIIWRHEHKVITFADMSSDGSVVAVLTSHGYLFCYNAAGEIQWYRRIFGSIVDGLVNVAGAGHNGLDVSDNGAYILVGGGNYWTQLYDAEGNLVWAHQGEAVIDTAEHPLRHSVMSVRISPDNTKIAAGYGYSDPRLVYFELAEDDEAFYGEF